ncbi:MAG: oligosaccharide flippase family protein, partial [Candidatus Eisenbacteria bacterium]|nr:oligosaccharide flippase family protein [Candidatus Eisenbacteria bacterium]
MSPKKSQQFTRDSLGLAFTQYLVRAVSMARGFVAAKMLDPMSFGAWNALQLMMDYGSLAPFGTQQGLDQMVPGRLVEGDAERTARVKRAALFNVLAFSVLFAALGLTWASVGSSRMRATWHLSGLGIALMCVMFVNVANVGTSILRSHGDIGGLTRWFVIQGLVGSGLGLVLMFWFGRWGLLWGWFAGCLVALFFVVYRGRKVFPLVPSPSVESLDLIQIGLPLYLFTASSLVMRNLDRIVVLRFLGTQALGYYGLSVNVLTLLMAIPDSLVYVSYPQLVKRFSEAGQDPTVLQARVDRLARGISVGLPLAAGLCAIGAPALVHAVLPKYDPCVGAMQVLAFGATGIALSSLASIVLMTVGRRVILIPAAIFLTALSGGLQLLSLRWNGGLTGVAAASSLAYLISGGVLLALAGAGMGLDAKRMGTQVMRCLAPTAIAALVLAGVSEFVLGKHLTVDL